MDDPQWRLQERELTWGDLQHADDLAVCNALRGVMRAVLD
jgi:branched-subunit amino acid aminotransferase/4-amino-4-deoxychorismate lyase